MRTLTDLEKRMHQILNRNDMLFTIGDVIRATGLKPTQIHYWEQKGFIKPRMQSKNQEHLYDHKTLIKIELIQSYLRSGFTLKMAAKKAEDGCSSANLIKEALFGSIKGITTYQGQPAVDFGALSNHPKKHLYLVVAKDHAVKLKIVKK